ncbi:hypothetical protein HYX13_01195 [Candidatus Woesearchaeota archaeon]|nr:hypothetical protein [Candidatus Woesearchaeota archaeon]
MKDKLKRIFLSWRVLLLVVFLIFALVSLQPRIFGNEGITIRSVVPESSASIAGIENPSSKLTPLEKEKIISLNGEKITSIEEYFKKTATLIANKTVRVETNKRVYTLQTKENVLGKVDLGLRVQKAPTTNLRKGLDLEGGTRVVLQPEKEVSSEDLESIIASLTERLNVFGLSDVVIRSAADLSGGQFIIIEIAGVTEEEVKELLGKQGKFEAKISNQTVFLGGKQDITYVCRSAECSGIDPNRACGQVAEGYACSFFFSITLSPEAAERQAQLTRQLSAQRDGSSCYLSEDLKLHLDDKEVDQLRIGCELQGRATTEIQISGSGVGRTEQEAMMVTLENMKRLQTIIITGSLPVKLEIVKLDTISPTLGQEFLKNVIFVGVLALIAVMVVIFIRYRKFKISIPLACILIAEMILVLGFAALVRWNLDLASIAGIIITSGTAVNHLIVITDEAIRGEKHALDWKKRIKQAIFIITGAYLTVLAAMIPLWFAGAGLLKGFAFTTIAGLSFGVLIARPAYAAIIEKLLQE